jgi:hypothetical protein
MTLERLVKNVHLVLLALMALPVHAPANKPAREEGEFRIVVGGKEVGIERYEIVELGDRVQTTSVVDFRNPEVANQKVHFETTLETDGRYTPQRYVLKSEVDGKKGTITGTFRPNQVMFEYASEAGSRKSGLLTGKEYTLLDTNVFHHFSFIARLFEVGDNKAQKLEVVIPQEADSGTVTVSDAGKQNVTVRGKKVQARHLLLDTGVLKIDLWVDDARAVQRMEVPSKAVLVERIR